MGVRNYKPTTAGRRGMTSQDFSQVTDDKSPKKLRSAKKSKAGRNNAGRITVRRRGGGAKKAYRHVSFDLPEGVKLTVEAIEYDPNRSARIARVRDDKGGHYYTLAPNKVKIGDSFETGGNSEVEAGNRLKLESIPIGTVVHNIELTPGKGGQLARSAGTRAQLTAKEGKYGTIKLPSGEVRMVLLSCKATVGSVGNEQHQNIKLGSAGRKRHKGRRPSVRGKVMNAADHPHGGGDGGSHGVGRDPKTPWGKRTLGYRTRRRKASNKLIVRSKHVAKRKKK